MVFGKRKGDSTAVSCISQWMAVILILYTTNRGNGLSTTPKTDDVIIFSSANSSNSSRIFLPHHFESNNNLNINPLASSSYNKSHDEQNLVTAELIPKPSHYINKNNDNNDDNHHLNLNNNSENISIAKSTNASSISSGYAKDSGGSGTSNDNNKRRSIQQQHSQQETEINQNEIENEQTENFGEIYFGTENFTTITTQIGSVVVIPCTVYNIDKETISWIRRKDYHLLTVDSTTYSGDARFNTIHIPDSKDWTLQIKYVQSRDDGLYECQVSTHPPTSTFTRLKVIEASAHIPGPMERYLKPGSTLKLTCRVEQSLDAPLYLFWYHNSRMINYDLHRGINVTTDFDNRQSELTIFQASTARSGNYSCVPSNTVPASTVVHILYGENPAAMQHGDSASILLFSPLLTVLVILVTYQSIRLS